jgi:hypothetical protein
MHKMIANHAFWKPLQNPATLLIVMTCFAVTTISAERTYSPKNADELEIISLVLASEVRANNWTKHELICISVEYKDPDKKLVKALRQQGLNVCKLSDWRKNLACGFQVHLRFMGFDTSQTARLHTEVADVRDINTGSAHVAGRIREGEYTLRKTEGKWSIGNYVPSK